MATQLDRNQHYDSQASISNRKSLGIRARLLIGFGGVGIILLLLVVVNLYFIIGAREFSIDVARNVLPTYDAFLDLSHELYKGQVLTQRFVVTNNEKYKNEAEHTWENVAAISDRIESLQPYWLNPVYKQEWIKLKPLLTKIRDEEQYVFNMPISDKPAQINRMVAELAPLMAEAISLLNAHEAGNRGLLDLQSDELQNGAENIMHNLGVLEVVEVGLLLLCGIVSIVISLYTANNILKKINAFREHSNRVASGDLTYCVEVESGDELGQLGDDLNKMTQGLATVTKQITEACHNMVGALEEVRRAVESQSSGSAEQASSINQITASLSEIEKSSEQTMQKAQTLGELAMSTSEKGQVGLEAVEQSVTGMKAIKDKVQIIAQTILDLSHQTQQVGEITAVVNNLAQQSKMLALNASIEAAKAGEAGKGFAVVATEVKNLAEQSEQSTAQVQKILEDIRHATEKAVMVTEEGTKGVDHGAGLVEQTGEVIRNLNEAIHEATIASQQIQAAIRQEGAGIEQITAGMNEINIVTSTFVESANQTKEAINNLADIARDLKSYIDLYKV